jgi:hypothetical protein
MPRDCVAIEAWGPCLEYARLASGMPTGVLPCPEGINTGDFFPADRIGERPCANAIDIAAVINQMASRFDGQFRVWIPDDLIHRAQSIPNVPCHSHRIGERPRWRTSWYFYLNEASPPRGLARLLCGYDGGRDGLAGLGGLPGPLASVGIGDDGHGLRISHASIACQGGPQAKARTRWPGLLTSRRRTRPQKVAMAPPRAPQNDQ